MNCRWFMDKEKRAEVLVARLKKCLAAVKILIWIPVAMIVALVVFAAVAALTGFGGSNKIVTLAVTIVLGGTAALAAIAVTVCFAVAYLSLSALKKLGGEEKSPADGEKKDE